MRPFRFRAQAALQLRRREHDQALASLARAQSAVATAQRGVDDAEVAVRDAGDRLTVAMRTPTAMTQLGWYRSWRVQCTTERGRRGEWHRACEADLRKAAATVNSTHQRVRSLEHLHDHALADWQRAIDREERKTMDALATSRFTRRKDEE